MRPGAAGGEVGGSRRGASSQPEARATREEQREAPRRRRDTRTHGAVQTFYLPSKVALHACARPHVQRHAAVRCPNTPPTHPSPRAPPIGARAGAGGARSCDVARRLPQHEGARVCSPWRPASPHDGHSPPRDSARTVAPPLLPPRDARSVLNRRARASPPAGASLGACARVPPPPSQRRAWRRRGQSRAAGPRTRASRRARGRPSARAGGPAPPPRAPARAWRAAGRRRPPPRPRPRPRAPPRAPPPRRPPHRRRPAQAHPHPWPAERSAPPLYSPASNLLTRHSPVALYLS